MSSLEQSVNNPRRKIYFEKLKDTVNDGRFIIFNSIISYCIERKESLNECGMKIVLN